MTTYNMILLPQIPVAWYNKHISSAGHISYWVNKRALSLVVMQVPDWAAEANDHFDVRSLDYHGRRTAECQWQTATSSFHPEVIYHSCSHSPKHVINPHRTSKEAETCNLTLCPERGGDLWMPLMTVKESINGLSLQWVEEPINLFIKQSFSLFNYADLSN